MSMDTSGTLKVRVERRGDRYVWELHRDGVVQPIKYSAPIYLSEKAAKASGDAVRKDHLARLAARRAKTGGDAADGSQALQPPPSAKVPNG
jgi:hypothetical protein